MQQFLGGFNLYLTEQTNEEKGNHLLGLFFKEYDRRKIRKQPVNFLEITTIDRLNLNVITQGPV